MLKNLTEYINNFNMKFQIFLILLCTRFIINTADPFSFKEIDSIENFDLIKPKFLKTSDNAQLAYYDFLKNKNKVIVIIYPGAGLYGNKTYQWVAKTLNEKYEIGSYIFDVRGHGNSSGERADATSINRVWQDVQEAIEFVKKENIDSKVYLAGHSSGSGLIINYAANMKNKLEDGYIFLAPYLGPKSDTARLYVNSSQSFIKTLRIWVYILGSIFPNSFITHFKALFFNYPDSILKSDPLILSYYTYAMSCAVTPYEIDLLLKKINKPTAIFIGNNDEQFTPEKIIAYKNLINAPVYTQIVENAAHLSILLNAPDLIFNYIKAFNLNL